MREVGGVTGKRDVGYKAAKCKEGHGYIFLFILTNDPISGDRR